MFLAQKKDFKMHKISQKCPFYKGFRGRIVKGKGYELINNSRTLWMYIIVNLTPRKNNKLITDTLLDRLAIA